MAEAGPSDLIFEGLVAAGGGQTGQGFRQPGIGEHIRHDRLPERLRGVKARWTMASMPASVT
jgi:hypothetical protein